MHPRFLQAVDLRGKRCEVLVLQTNPRKGERGLAQAPVTVWVHDGSLKVEHQAVTLSQYRVDLQDDHKHLSQVSHPRLAETPFRSPQLALFDLGPGEWLLYWKTPSLFPARRRRRVPGMVQLPLFDQELLDLAVGSDETSTTQRQRSHLSLLGPPQSD